MKQFLKMWLLLLSLTVVGLAVIFGMLFIGSLIFKTRVSLIIFILLTTTAIAAFLNKDSID